MCPAWYLGGGLGDWNRDPYGIFWGSPAGEQWKADSSQTSPLPWQLHALKDLFRPGEEGSHLQRVAIRNGLPGQEFLFMD